MKSKIDWGGQIPPPLVKAVYFIDFGTACSKLKNIKFHLILCFFVEGKNLKTKSEYATPQKYPPPAVCPPPILTNDEEYQEH